MTTDPLSAQCPACLAAPGDQCYATSTDEPRRHPHRLRGLAAAKRLIQCEHCGGVGWRPETGTRSSRPDAMTLTMLKLVAGLTVRRAVRAAVARAEVLGADVRWHEDRGLLESVFTIRADGTKDELAPLLKLAKRAGGKRAGQQPGRQPGRYIDPDLMGPGE